MKAGMEGITIMEVAEEDMHSGGYLSGESVSRDGNTQSRRNRRPSTATVPAPAWCSGLSVAITGGCGFLGLHIARLLYKESNDVLITLVDIAPISDDALRFITGSITNGHRVHYCHGNIRIRDDLRKAFDKADIVIHCAAKSDVRMDMHINREMEATNVEGTENVIRACQSCGVQALVYVGSLFQVIRDGVYNQEGIDETWTVGDNDELVMDTMGWSKNRAEREVLTASANRSGKGNLYTCSVRCPPLYGEHDTALIPSAAWAASKFMGYYPRIGSPGTKMTVMYVENAAFSLICAARKLVNETSRGTVGGNFYYVSDDTPSTSYSDFFGRFLRELDYDVRLRVRLPIKFVTFWLYLVLVFLVFLMIFFDVRNIDGLVMKYQHQVKILSISHTVSRAKAKRELGYAPHVAPELAFEKSRNYYVRTCSYV